MAHRLPDPAAPPGARDARLLPADLDPDDPRVRARHVPRGAESQVIGTTAIDLWTQGETGSVAALATLQIAVTAVVACRRNPAQGQEGEEQCLNWSSRTSRSPSPATPSWRISIHRRRRRVLHPARPGGCGKSTTLPRRRPGDARRRAHPRRRPRSSTAPRAVSAAGERNLGLVFQSYALWPHMTVARTSRFAAEAAQGAAAETRRAFDEALESWGWPAGDRYPTSSPAASSSASRSPARWSIARGAAAGRAALQPRREAARAVRARVRRAAAAARHHHDLRDARPGRGAGALRPDRGDERGG